jgi:hypothetical protein
LTTVPSRKTTNDPSTAAMRTMRFGSTAATLLAAVDFA